MIYRRLGSTGIRVSRLGFGAMRPPMLESEPEKVDADLYIAMLHRAIDLGVNYIDTAHIYQAGQSEECVGRAVRGRRDQITISTKIPSRSTAKEWQKRWESSLKRLNTHVDLLFFHGLSLRTTESRSFPAMLKRAERAVRKGDARMLAFSCHDTPENVEKLVGLGLFKAVLVQYNLLNRKYEKAIAYAHRKGLGTLLMGPVGGGRLAVPSRVLRRLSPVKVKDTAELALRFVFSNPNVDCALSGMNTFEMIDRNVETASLKEPFTAAQRAKLVKAVDSRIKVAYEICTGCGYCMPCPLNIDIPRSFEALTLKRIWGLDQYAQRFYDRIGGPRDWAKREKPTKCIECGKCEPKCPQSIPIRKQLKEVVRLFEPAGK